MSGVRIRWVRLLEGILAMGLLVALFVVVAGPARVGQVVARARPGLVAAALLGAVVWLLAWSETLYLLVRAQWPAVDGPRFRVAFLGGMGARGLVPGGSVSGPAVLAYVVTTSTDAEPEGTTAFAYLAEFLYWLASLLVVAVGFLGVVTFGSPTGEVYSVVASLVGVLAIALVAVAVLVRRPGIARWTVHRAVALPRAALGDRIPRVGRALDPGTVDRRLDRFLGSFARLAAEPRRVGPAFGAALLGWVANVFVLATALAAVGAPVPAYVPLFVVPVGGFARTVSLLPGGIGGVGPAMTTLLVALGDVGLAAAGAAVLLYRVATFWFRLGIGAACLFGLGLADGTLPGTVDPDAE